LPLVSLLNYGLGNLRSVKRGLEKVGARVLITQDQMDLSEAEAIVLPGVGAFATAVENLAPLSGVVKQCAADGKLMFGICLGLQLLFTRSEEGGSADGLDLISGDVAHLPEAVKIPQMGWNTIDMVKPHPLLDDIPQNSYVYFAHTYFPDPLDRRVVIATTEYGIRFPSIIAKQNLLGTQFHPEKSGKIGSTILKNFLNIVRR
jgi:glutamine amidotransferase